MNCFNCFNCKSDRLAEVNGKCSDMCYVNLCSTYHNGYVPHDMNIGGGDYIRITYCLDCGQMQGEFPLPPTKLE